jgi:hypothetical protein
MLAFPAFSKLLIFLLAKVPPIFDRRSRIGAHRAGDLKLWGRQMLTVKQSAAIAGISTGLVYVWVEQGVLPHFRLGRPGSRGAIRIAEADLRRFLDSMKQQARPQETSAAPPPSKSKPAFRHLRLG